MSEGIISDKAVQEFKKIYKKDYGVELDDGVAFELAHKFFHMMRVVYRPIKKRDDNPAQFKK